MSGQTHRDDLARRFLLGKLTEEDQSAFEERFFEDDGVFEELEIAEEELIELYLDGRLDPGERGSFEERMATSPRLRERVIFAQILANKVDSMQAPAVAASSEPSWWERLFGSGLFQRPAFRMALVAALLIVVLGGVAWMVRKSRLETQRLEAQRILDQQRKEAQDREKEERATIPQQQPSPAPISTETPSKSIDTATLASIVLIPGASRSGGGANNELHLGAGIEKVQLTLVVEDTNYETFQVVAQGIERKTSWRRSAKLMKNSSRLTLELPVTMLQPDDYMIKVEGMTSNGTLEPVSDYTLRVRRK